MAENIYLKLEKQGVSRISDLRKDKVALAKSYAECAKEILEKTGTGIVSEFFRESILI